MSATFSIVDFVMDYEAGLLHHDQVVEGFAHLIRTGAVLHLQGSYQRAAADLIRSGFISEEGEIL